MIQYVAVEGGSQTNEPVRVCLLLTPRYVLPLITWISACFPPTSNKHTITGIGDQIACWYECECGPKRASQSLRLIGIQI